jgi:release factor glutamine methyltransferase
MAAPARRSEAARALVSDSGAGPIGPATSRARARAYLSERLRRRGVEQPEREAGALLALAAGIRAADIIGAPEAPVGEAAARIEAFAARRLAGEPLSRIRGRREFWSLEFTISPGVLDPRADTETIVEAAVAEFAARRGEPLRILDLGTGSGAVLCALLAEFPKATGVGVDISEAAAAIARGNLQSLGLDPRGAIRMGDWGEGLSGPFDLIVSNPPYIREGDIAGLETEVRDHDPRLALDGGPDGLQAYRALAPELARLLAPAGRFFLEFGEGQGEDVSAILRGGGLDGFRLVDDLSGRARVVAGRRRDPLARPRGANQTASVHRDEGFPVSAQNQQPEQPRGDLTVRLIAMPADTNANGDIFGGWVMSQMDQAGGIAAAERASGRVVTISVEAMTFIRPVKVGDVLCVYTEVERVGRTSMKIHIEAWARRFRTNTREKVTDAFFTFVAIDENGRPRPVPPLGP